MVKFVIFLLLSVGWKHDAHLPLHQDDCRYLFSFLFFFFAITPPPIIIIIVSTTCTTVVLFLLLFLFITSKTCRFTSGRTCATTDNFRWILHFGKSANLLMLENSAKPTSPSYSYLTLPAALNLLLLSDKLLLETCTKLLLTVLLTPHLYKSLGII